MPATHCPECSQPDEPLHCVHGSFVLYSECDVCGKRNPFIVVLPYGSKYDDLVVCEECVRRIIDPAIDAWVDVHPLKQGYE